MVQIRHFVDSLHREPVIALWTRAFGYDAPRNAPTAAIDKKLAVDDALFFVAEAEGKVVGTVLAGYDGHRGWLYSVAVESEFQRRGIGAALVQHAEAALSALGCMKVNLQLLNSNEATAGFYQSLGYVVEQRISMGKAFEHNVPSVQ